MPAHRRNYAARLSRANPCGQASGKTRRTSLCRYSDNGHETDQHTHPARRACNCNDCTGFRARPLGSARPRRIYLRLAGRCRRFGLARTGCPRLYHHWRLKLSLGQQCRDLSHGRQASDLHAGPHARHEIHAARFWHSSRGRKRWKTRAPALPSFGPGKKLITCC